MEIDSISIAIPSSKDASVHYTVLANKHRATCTCPDYVYRRAESGEPCKHISYCIKKGKFSIDGI